MAEANQEFPTYGEVTTRLAEVIADAMQMSRPKRLEHQAAVDVLAALADGRVPDGLDARPLLRWTIHCSECGTVYREPEFEQVANWPTSCLPALGNFGLGDQDWHVNEFDGRPLVCPGCACVAWCEECGEEIQAWQPHWRDATDCCFHLACVAAPDQISVAGSRG